MKKSPGHQRWPDHKVIEKHLDGHVTVSVGDVIVADSTDVLEVDEDEAPARYYFPRSDVHMEMLEPTQTTTECPFKGTAHYFSVKLSGQQLDDAVWTYDAPYEEHQALKDRVAFYDDKFPALKIRASS